MKPQSEQNDYLEENDVNIVDNDSEENEEFRYSITSYGADCGFISVYINKFFCYYS